MPTKTFLTFNFGCRVNSAETNLFAQSLVNQGFTPDSTNPEIIFINTCAITKKGEYESLSTVKKISQKYPHSQIIVSGCATLSKLPPQKNLTIVNKDNLPSFYTHQIKDKFSHTHRYLLKVQSGCTANCSYCVVPNRRPELWSLPINDAVKIVNQAVTDGYQEIIVTGVNLNQYTPGFSNLIEALLVKTQIKLISFGSIPLLCLDEKFIHLLSVFNFRLSTFLHIPIQSGSDKILKLMNRPYDKQKIKDTFSKFQILDSKFRFGTDIIIGFPTETDDDFQQTLNLCQQIGFQKIHTFKFSPRPNTTARELFLQSPKIPRKILISRTKLLSHQKPDN